MKFLMDCSLSRYNAIESNLVCGQLLTPLTRYSLAAGAHFAIDNGAFTCFRQDHFEALLKREGRNKDRCLFVACPDVVGSGRRTLELFRHRDRFIQGWKVALVAQNGIEDLDIPWSELDCLFIGGIDPFKESRATADLVKTAKILGKHVHVGRVNTKKRFKRFLELGADTCDGSGIARFDHMLEAIEISLHRQPTRSLFDVGK